MVSSRPGKAPAVEKCKNCGTPIGALETPYVWRDRVVCGSCYGRLSTAAAGGGPIPYASPVAPRASSRVAARRWLRPALLIVIPFVVTGAAVAYRGLRHRNAAPPAPPRVPISVAPAPAGTGMVSGAVWLSLKNGDAHRQRGLPLFVVNPTLRKAGAAKALTSMAEALRADAEKEDGIRKKAVASKETWAAESKANAEKEQLALTRLERAEAVKAEGAVAAALVSVFGDQSRDEYEKLASARAAFDQSLPVLVKTADELAAEAAARAAKLRSRADRCEQAAKALGPQPGTRSVLADLKAADPFSTLASVLDVSNCPATATSDVDGKFEIPDLQRGSYYLYAHASGDSFTVDWLVPFTVGPGLTRVDLFNENADYIQEHPSPAAPR